MYIPAGQYNHIVLNVNHVTWMPFICFLQIKVITTDDGATAKRIEAANIVKVTQIYTIWMFVVYKYDASICGIW